MKNGWLPPWGLTALVARVGPVRARMMAWGVHEIDGSEAYRIGLADSVCAPGEALASAMDTATRLAALPRGAVRSTKRFFEQFATANSERLDAEASRFFAADALSDASRATLARFTVKA